MSLVPVKKCLPPSMTLKGGYGCMIADFPWPEIGGGQIKRGADRHYPVMSMQEIYALAPEFGKIMLPDAHLYLWVTNNYMEEGFKVARLCGFPKYITTITWEKERQGLGQYFRGTTEHVLFFRRGQPGYRIKPDGKRAQGRTSFITSEPMTATEVMMRELHGLPDVERIERILAEGLWFSERRLGKHSEKPAQIHEWAEEVSHGPYVEMFARSARPGWDAWGNQAPEEKPMIDFTCSMCKEALAFCTCPDILS